MVNLLIVDDENYVIEDIVASVNWEKIGISNVYTASNIFRAQEVFDKFEITIMLCDIEMPGGSGLELLSWVHGRYPKTKVILITCHADFSYAKEAIRLGSFDYVLKPILYDELEAIIEKAIDKFRLETTTEEYGRYGQFWFKHQQLLVERFWLDIINREIPSNAEEIKKAADHRNIPYTSAIKVMPLLISVQRWHDEQNLQDEKIMEFGLKNIAEEMFAAGGDCGIFFHIRRNGLLGILTKGSGAGSGRSSLREECCRYITLCNQHMCCDLSCYIGENVYAHELPDTVDRLLNMEKNNVTFYNKAFLLDKQAKNGLNVNAMDMASLSKMLNEGAKDMVVKEVRRYLETQARATGLDFQALYQFQQDFNQMVYAHMEGKGIKAHSLLGDNKSVELQIKGANSVKQMVEWIEYMVAKDIEYTAEIEKSQSVVHKVIKYLSSNLNRELTREEIANQVYLNPDYLDRIFKKETGVSVTKYITQQRIAVAKELLARTDTPISAIAESVGYSKLSNFSVMFKKFSGVNPIEYRRKALKSSL